MYWKGEQTLVGGEIENNDFTAVSHRAGSSGPDDMFDDDCYSPSSSLSSSPSSSTLLPSLLGNTLCTSCGQDIVDRYLLKVNNLCWHVRCLSCSVCQTSLGRHVSCYIKEKEVFCKLDYFRRYGTRCARCGRSIHPTDWVRRARGSTFHLACFSCTTCKRQLATGEEFGLAEDRVLCRAHYEVMVDNIKRTQENGKGVTDRELSSDQDGVGVMPRPAKRARTSFTVDQLQMMQMQFSKDNNPDAQTLQRLAEGTGLSRRVIQVWFQNCRARHKKHVIPGGLPSSVMTSLPASQLTQPLMEELQYTAFVGPDSSLLMTYMDVQNTPPMVFQPLMPHSMMTPLPVSHA